jgi:hypothetical protein
MARNIQPTETALGNSTLMTRGIALIAALSLAWLGMFMAQPLFGQEAPKDKWRPAERAPRVASASQPTSPAAASGGDAIAPLEALAPVASPAAPIAKVKQGIDELPREHGQVWREYDISPYTIRVTTTKSPQRAIIDWIFRETGYEVWHSDVVSVLSADTRTLRVYHTPQVQAQVADVVDRFVNAHTETHAFGIRVITLDHPAWRAKAGRIMKPLPVQTPGVQAWLLAKEDATFLLAELRKQSDFREHSSPHLLVNNGQSTVVAATRPRSYVRDVLLRPEIWPGFQSEMGQIDEGFSLEFSPLLSRDERTIDAAIKCNLDQVEKLIPVSLEVPTTVSQRQRTQVDVPQMAQYRLHERFRWPAEQVLLISAGSVPTPVPTAPGVLQMALPIAAAPRAELLIFLEGKGPLGQPPSATRTADRASDAYRGRY